MRRPTIRSSPRSGRSTIPARFTGGTPGADVKAVAAWDIIHDAPNVIVAMIDDGVRLDHEDIAPNLWRNPSPTFGDINGARIIRDVRSGDVTDESGHGTHTAGIVGGAGNNGVGITGLAWRVQLMVLKNSGADGASSSRDAPGTRTSRVRFTPASAGTSYFIAVGGKDGAEGYAQLNISPAAPNDDFASATTLNGDSAQGAVRTNTATIEPGEPRILGFSGGASVWYKWVAPRSARFQVSAFSLDFDTLLAVYTGASLDSLTPVTSNDNTNPGPGLENNDSRCALDAAAGVIYYFQVDTKSAARGAVTVTVTDSLWQLSSDGGEFTASPAIAPDGTIYIGAITPDRRLYAVNPDGTLKWTYSAGGGIDVGSAAIANDGTIYQGSADGKLVALTPAGTVRWTHDFGSANSVAVTPAVAADGTIYTHALDGFLYALEPTGGTTKWRFNVTARSTFASAVVAPDGTIYQGSDDQNFYAVNPDGTLKWRFAAGSDSFTTPALDAAGNIYYATYSTPSSSHSRRMARNDGLTLG